MNDTVLDTLRAETEALLKLLSDPQPGLATWTMALARQIEKVAAVAGYVPASEARLKRRATQVTGRTPEDRSADALERIADALEAAQARARRFDEDVEIAN
jgi:hypothetical protein